MIIENSIIYTKENIMKAGDIITLEGEPYEKFFSAMDYLEGLYFVEPYIWLCDFDGAYHDCFALGKHTLTLDEDKKGFTYRLEEEAANELFIIFDRSIRFTSQMEFIVFEHIKDLQYRFLGVFSEADEVSYKFHRVGCRFKRVYETCSIKGL